MTTALEEQGQVSWWKVARNGQGDAENMTIGVIVTHIGQREEAEVGPPARAAPADLGGNGIGDPGHDGLAESLSRQRHDLAAAGSSRTGRASVQTIRSSNGPFGAGPRSMAITACRTGPLPPDRIRHGPRFPMSGGHRGMRPAAHRRIQSREPGSGGGRRCIAGCTAS